MSRELFKLIDQGEHQQLDFKFEISDSKKIARSLVAFANTDGGRLLVGVKDNGAIAGVRSEEEYYMLDAAASMYSKPEINFKTKIWRVEKKTVLEVEINKSLKAPHMAKSDDGKWIAYVRVKDQNIAANNIILKVWELKKKNKSLIVRYSKAEQNLLQYLKENKNITCEYFKKLAQLTTENAEDILASLIVLNILKYELTESECYYSLIKS